MKKSQEIIGLSVFAIIDGREIGHVKDLVVNPEEGQIDYVLVSSESWFAGPRVLDFASVEGIGEHALTTERETLLKEIIEEPAAVALLQRNVQVKGNRVLTNKGNFIGIVTEYAIDENNGKILQVEYKDAKDTEMEIAAANVLTYGSDVLVVREVKEPSAPVQVQTTEVKTSEGAALFKERQKQFLIGKQVMQDIKDINGSIVIAEGTIITEEIIDLADQQGKFIELSQSSK